MQSSVLEYINDFLDKKCDGKKRFLNNKNIPNESYFPIHINFRLICTTLLSDINKLSPGFDTRMDIKILKICMNNIKTGKISYGGDIKKE